MKSPIAKQVDTEAENCSVSFNALTELQQQLAPVAENSHQLEGSPRSIFMAPDIRRYQPAKALPTNQKVAMPAEVRKLLGWSKREAARSVGAYPAR